MLETIEDSVSCPHNAPIWHPSMEQGCWNLNTLMLACWEIHGPQPYGIINRDHYGGSKLSYSCLHSKSINEVELSLKKEVNEVEILVLLFGVRG